MLNIQFLLALASLMFHRTSSHFKACALTGHCVGQRSEFLWSRWPLTATHSKIMTLSGALSLCDSKIMLKEHAESSVSYL